jgi:DNA-binding transcriptional regulator GbsR (MarR family)
MSSKLITKTTGKIDKKPVFTLEKDFSLNNISQVKNELDEIIDKNKEFHLELKNIENFDLSSIQLLHALKNKLGNGFSYSLSVKDEIKTIIMHSGFDNLVNK